MAAAETKSSRPTLTVQVEPDKVTRFHVGSRWRVVASTLDSLWQGAYTVTLEEIDDEEEASRGRS